MYDFRALSDYMKEMAYPAFVIHLGGVFEKNDATPKAVTPDAMELPGFELAPKLDELFASVKSESGRSDLKFRLKILLLHKMAEKFEAKKLILATTASSLAR